MKLLIPIMSFFLHWKLVFFSGQVLKLGVWNTVLLIILTGILGVFFARKQGFEIMQKIRTALQNWASTWGSIARWILRYDGWNSAYSSWIYFRYYGIHLLIAVNKSFSKTIFDKVA